MHVLRRSPGTSHHTRGATRLRSLVMCAVGSDMEGRPRQSSGSHKGCSEVPNSNKHGLDQRQNGLTPKSMQCKWRRVSSDGENEPEGPAWRCSGASPSDVTFSGCAGQRICARIAFLELRGRSKRATVCSDWCDGRQFGKACGHPMIVSSLAK